MAGGLPLRNYYLDAKQYTRLLRVVAPAAAAHPDLADLQYLAGAGFQWTGQTRRAKASYGRALALVPSMAEAKRALSSLDETR